MIPETRNVERMYRRSTPMWEFKPVQPKLVIIKQILDGNSDIPDRGSNSPEAVILRSIRAIVEAED